jgi:phosphatidate cytidylyltransferase
VNKKISDRNLLKAILVGIALGGLFLISVIFYKLIFLVICILIAVKAYMELSKAFQIDLPVFILSLCTAGVLAITYFLSVNAVTLYFFITLLIMSLYTSVINIEIPFLQKFPQLIFSYVYFCIPLTMAILILQNKGHNYLIFLVLISVSSDVGGHLIGSIFGKHKMAKNISPNKTVEGFLGSIFLSLITANLFSFFVLHIDIWIVILYTIIIVSMGTFGDLCESLLKRSVNLKDFGTILSGHGGVLDRFDGLLILLPIFYPLITIL